jgi:hypothetical protein
MLVPLSRLAPAAIKHSDCRTDFGGCCGCWIIERANKRLKRLCGVVARPQRKRAEVARQRPTYRLPPRGTFLCACSWTFAAARHFDFISLMFQAGLIRQISARVFEIQCILCLK